MEPPELTNFGSLIRFAIELEAATAAFYGTAEGLVAAGPPKDLTRELAAQHEARRALLLRTRQQKLNEMVLEPITGLDGRRYVYEAGVGSAAQVPQTAMGLEAAAERLYKESAEIAKSLLTEAARTFRKLADENLRNLGALRGMFRE